MSASDRRRLSPEHRFKTPRRDDGALRRPAGGDGGQRRDRAALRLSAPDPEAHSAALFGVRRRRGRRGGRASPPGAGRARGAARASRPRAGAYGRGLRGTPRLRARRYREDEIPRLFPHRRRLHPVGERAGDPGRAGPRVGRGFACRLGAHHHRPRPDALRPLVRAVPEPRTRVDAGLRHRLLPGPARRGDRLCPRALRRRPGGADHHLRLVPRPRRPAQRRPGARDAARPGRQARETRAPEPCQTRDAETGRRGRGAPAGGRQGRRARGRDARHRRASRRALFERLDPRGGRRHRRPAADRTRAALPRPESGDAGDPVQHEMGRARGAGQVRLPRPQDADDLAARDRPRRPAGR